MPKNIFGEDYEIVLHAPKVKDTIKRIEQATLSDAEAEKVLKSKKISLQERLLIIKENVLRVLGKQKENVIVIKDKKTFDDYISNAITAGRIAIDTETNNSLDPVTCKLMGPCLYYPGGKQAYIPLNHRDPVTKERFSWQLTEHDCREEFQQIIDSKIPVIMHNGKFDYEVIKCTCGIAVKPDWDTMVAARLLNENEPASLKWQYTNKLDKSQEKYDIEKLFENVAYADVDPEIFALYAAHDAAMTDALYELQKAEMDKDEYGQHPDMTGTKMLPGIRWLFHEVEMPIVVVTAEMELTGVCVDEDFGARLKVKYTQLLDDLDSKINAVLNSLNGIISAWRLLPTSNESTKTYVPKKTKMTQAKIEQQYPNIDEEGNRYKLGKSKSLQLEETINLASPAQLAILFYDVLEVEEGDKENRKTGKDELKSIKEKLAGYLTNIEENIEEIEETLDDEDDTDVEEAIAKPQDQSLDIKWGYAANLADLLLKRRKLAKLITTYIDVIPDLVKHWPDGRIRFHLNSLGTDTGRYSSGGKLKFMENEVPIEVSGINIQNIPSHNPEIRMLFTAQTKSHVVLQTDNYFSVPETDEVETAAGWKFVSDLVIGDELLCNTANEYITKIEKIGTVYNLYV